MQHYKIAYDTFQTKTEHYCPKKGHFGQSVPENGPPSSRMATYQKTSGGSHKEKCATYCEAHFLQLVLDVHLRKRIFIFIHALASLDFALVSI